MSDTAQQPDEVVVARVHRHGAILFLPAILFLVSIFFAVYYSGRRVPEWGYGWLSVALFAFAALVILAPYLSWISKVTIVTTERLILKSGFLVRRRQEILLNRNFNVTVRRGLGQRLIGSGNVLVDVGLADPVVIQNVPRPLLLMRALQEISSGAMHSGPIRYSGPIYSAKPYTGPVDPA